MSFTTVAPALGAAVAASHVCTKAPRLVEWARAKSAARLPACPSSSSSYCDLCVFSTRLAYHIVCGYPFSTWAELPVLMLNNLASLALVHRTARERSYTAGPYTVRFGQHGACRTSKRYRASFMLPVARDVIVLCAAFCALRQLPRAALCVLHLATMTSRATTLQRARDRANYLRRSTGGALRAAPVLRRWARSAGRVVTTIVQLGADPAVLLTHLLTVLGCSVMLAQGWWYRRASERALTSAPLQVPPGPLSGAARYDYLLSALMWRSLGGLDETESGKSISRAKMQEAFSRLASTNGEISSAKLSLAISAARPGVSEAVKERMLRAADLDSDGVVVFEEYAQIMRTEFENEGH